MRQVLLVLTGLISAAVLSVAQAPDQPPTGPRPTREGSALSMRGGGLPRGSRGLPVVAAQMIAQGDKDGDKELSKDEFTALAEVWFTKLDSAGAGKLSQEQMTTGLRELFPAASATPDGGPAPLSPEVLGPILFGATDADKDGALTRAEFKEAFANWFNLWDTTKAGKLNQDALLKGLEIALPRSGLRARAGEVVRRPGGTPTTEAARATERVREQRPLPAPRAREEAASSPSPSPREVIASVGRSSTPQVFDGFKIISDRNIFNPNRRARSARNSEEEEKPRKVDTLTLVGTLVYEKGPYAFFDGDGASKVSELGATVAGYKLAAISGNGVQLTKGTNSLDLRVGMQLRREEEGEWQVVAGSGPPTETSSTASSSSSSSSTSSDDDDIVKRLMKQREQELK